MADWNRRRFVDPSVSAHLLREVDEVIVREVPHHWVVFVLPGLELLVAFGVFLLAVVGPAATGVFFLLVCVALLVHGGYRMLREHKDRFVLTNMRVFRVSGVFNEKVATMPLARILDITMDKPFAGRLLGYGHFTFESAAQEQGLKNIRYVGEPDSLDLKIQETVQRSGLRGPKVR